MHVKPIIKPPVSETFFYGKIISWKFSDSVTYVKARKNTVFVLKLFLNREKFVQCKEGDLFLKQKR